MKNKKMGRNYGKVHSMTRAPIRCWNGGLKFTEMEVDAILSNGGCKMMIERMMNQADIHYAIFCKRCGHMGDFDSSGSLPCVHCKGTEMVRSAIPFISQVILHMLRTCNIKLERILDCQLTDENREFQKYLEGSRDPRINNYVRNLLNHELPSYTGEASEESSTQTYQPNAERSNDSDAESRDGDEEEEEGVEEEGSDEEDKGYFFGNEEDRDLDY